MSDYRSPSDRDAAAHRERFIPVPTELDAELAAFVSQASSVMAERLAHGAAKFGTRSWREDAYEDEDNLDRLRRAVDHLEAARRNSPDETEWRKRAADVANQAFMFADPARWRSEQEAVR